MSDRIPCKTIGCSKTILPATAERTDGYCMPCVQAAEKRKREEYIKQNRRDVNEFHGVTDLVEVLKIVHRSRKHDPLVNWIPHPTPVDRLYAELSEDESNRLVEYARSLVGGEWAEDAETIVRCLAAFTGVRLEACLKAMIANSSFWPGLAFRDASPDIRDLLIAQVERDETNRNHLLCALAWIGDSVVVDLFARWKFEPPDWSSSLHVAPEEYSYEAGWELTGEGRRRDLFFHQCWRLAKGSSKLPAKFQAITPADGCCPWCDRQLIHLVTFKPEEFGVADAFGNGVRVQVTTCEVCSAFGIVFGEYNALGHGRWSPENSRPEYLPDDSGTWDCLPRDPLTLAGQRNPLSAADQFLPTTFSQLGGHPTWVQDASYPRCTRCSESMIFLTQVDNADFEEHTEGIYYAFACPQCRTTATTYQQT